MERESKETQPGLGSYEGTEDVRGMDSSDTCKIQDAIKKRRIVKKREKKTVTHVSKKIYES